MKKILLASVLALALTWQQAAPTGVYADEPVKLVVDGQAVTQTEPPALIGGAVLVPFKSINALLGAEVAWDNAAKTATATKGDVTVVLRSGERTAAITRNGVAERVALESPAVIRNGRNQGI